jgi:hypothetical protein
MRDHSPRRPQGVYPMSERMTSIKLPGVWGAGWAEYGRKEPSEMIAAIRRHAQHEIAWAEKVLAADDADFRVDTYLGPHAQRNREILQEGKESIR